MADEKNPDSTEAVALVNHETGEVLDINKMTESLDSMKPGMEITGEYMEFVEGEEEKLFVIGSQKMKAIDSDDYIDAIRFLTRDGRFVINADAVVRSTLLEHAQSKKGPYPVSVLCTGKAGPKGREYKTFKIHPLG